MDPDDGYRPIAPKFTLVRIELRESFSPRTYFKPAQKL